MQAISLMVSLTLIVVKFGSVLKHWEVKNFTCFDEIWFFIYFCLLDDI